MKKTYRKDIIVAWLCFVLIAAVKLSVLTGALGIATQGIIYFSNEVDRYAFSSRIIDEVIEFSVDINDLESNKGKIIYRNGECYIEIDEVSFNGDEEGHYRIFFRSHGDYSLKGATLVSGIKHERIETDCHAELQIKDGEAFYNCTVAGLTGLSYNDGDQFGFHFLPKAHNTDGTNTVVFSLSNLIENTWTEK